MKTYGRFNGQDGKLRLACVCLVRWAKLRYSMSSRPPEEHTPHPHPGRQRLPTMIISSTGPSKKVFVWLFSPIVGPREAACAERGI